MKRIVILILALLLLAACAAEPHEAVAPPAAAVTPEADAPADPPEPEELPAANEDGSFPTPETDFTYLLMPVRLPG